MRLFKKKTCLLSLLFFIVLSSSAQRFPFFNLKVENGLIQSQATCLAQDQFGNLWIGTLGGLSRYDGKKIKNITLSDGLVSNNIMALHFTKNGQLLVSTAKGLQLFDGQKFATILSKDKQNIVGVSSFCALADGKTFCLKFGKIYQIDMHNLQAIAIDTSTLYTSILASGPENILTANSNGDIVTIALKQGYEKKILAKNTEPHLVVLKLFTDSKSKLWVLTNKGIYTIENQKLEAYQPQTKPTISEPLISAAEDNNGNIWLASIRGVYRMKEGSVSYFDQRKGLTNNTILELLSDKEGNIWMASDGEGVFRYSGGPFISIDGSFGLPDKQVNGIAGDELGTIFFSGYQGKLSSYRFGEMVKSIDAPTLHNDAITVLKYQLGKGLWIGTRRNGLYLRNTMGQITKANLNPIAKNPNDISSLFVSTDGTLYVGYHEGLLAIKEEKTLPIGLNGATPIAMASVGEDSLLIASTGGFYLYHNAQVHKWKAGTILDSLLPQCMVQSDNYLYLGTTEQGLFVYDYHHDKFQNYTSKNGLSSDFIYNLTKDNDGNIWAGTGMGICKLSQTTDALLKIKTYGKANGIIGLESNSNASFADNEGRLWFGTTEGVSCYFPNAMPTSAKVMSVVLESVRLYGGKAIDSNFYLKKSGWYSIPSKLKLPYKYNNISFVFQAISLSPLDRIWYRYQLQGASATWSEWSEENSINFSALAPGDYTLKVMCKINGVPQKTPTCSYSFIVETPFYKSTWFIFSVFGLAILTGVILQYAAQNRKHKRLKREELLRKEEQSKVRERTAEDFHDEVGNKLTRIKVLASVLKSKLNLPNPDAERILQQIQDNSEQLYAGTRDILWSLQPANDNLYEILNHVADLGNELFSETDIAFRFSGNNLLFKDYKMPLDKSRNFIMIWKEALNNCMKYADAKNVLLQVQQDADNAIVVRLVDDGSGFDTTLANQGNGLKNMKARAHRLDAQLQILSKVKMGTQIVLTLGTTKQ
ncbi:MAG: hypothetical protein IT256_01125 [Chitinophagaceae bacterium]|nr:hypothetical protein [Chitinophagaceae bacterium]